MPEDQKEEVKADVDMQVEQSSSSAAPAVPEEPKELETDAPADKRPKANVPVEVNLDEATVNVMPSSNGKVLMSLADGGLQYLCGAARVNVGVKAGRYLFEVKVIECRSLQGQSGKAAGCSLSVGFSGAGSSLYLSENASSASFESSEGCFQQGKWKAPEGKRFGAFDVVGILLNLDSKSANHNTVSLFINGVRSSKPQAIPEDLHGKALFPTINFTNMSLHLNFGPAPLAPLPFTCHMLQDAAKADVEVVAKKTGKKEVIFPVGLPDEGTFRFLEGFLQENPGFTEKSDRAIQAWARNSGIWPRGGHVGSNDKPSLDFGNRDLDELSLRKSIDAAAAYYEKSYVHMEVKGNLLADERKKALEKYGSNVKKIAVVALGEPPKAFKAKVHQEMLEHKKWKAGEEAKKKHAEEVRAHAARKQEKEREKAAKAREAKRAAAQERLRKAKEEKEKKAKEEKEKKEEDEKKKEDGEAIDVDAEDGGEDKKDEEKKAEEEPAADEADAEGEKEEAKEEAKEEEKEEEEEEEEPLESLEDAIKKAEEAVELDDEEKSKWFLSGELAKARDVSSKELSASFGSFTLPKKDEGFDEIRFVWAKEKDSEQYIQAWIKERKLTNRVEDIVPGAWFKEQQRTWRQHFDQWHQRHADWNDPMRRQRLKDAAKAKKTQENKDDDGEKDNKESEGEDEAMADAESDEELDPLDTDTFDAEDINNLGKGQPLYANFEFEDWCLCSLRHELHLLVHAFAKDMEAVDPERTTFLESHLSFYFKKFFQKDFSVKFFNECKSVEELLELVPDVVEIRENKTLGPLMSDDTPLDNFVRLTEEARRERVKLMESGIETAAIKIVRSDRRVKGKGEGGKGEGNKGEGGKAKGKADRGAYGKGGDAHSPVAAGPGGTMRLRPSSGLLASRMAPQSRASYGQAPAGPSSMGSGAVPMRAAPMRAVPAGYGAPAGPAGAYGGGRLGASPSGAYGGGRLAPAGYGPPPGYGAPSRPAPGFGASPARAGYGMSAAPPGGFGASSLGAVKRGAYGAPAGGMAPMDKRARTGPAPSVRPSLAGRSMMGGAYGRR